MPRTWRVQVSPDDPRRPVETHYFNGSRQQAHQAGLRIRARKYGGEAMVLTTPPSIPPIPTQRTGRRRATVER